MIAAVIPARGGSKGVLRKNLRELGGVSLIRRAVDTCRASGVDQVYVSTDDEEIAEECDAKVIWRPDHLATDEALSQDVLLHAVDCIGSVDVVAFVQCTAPLMTAYDIDSTIAVMRAGKHDAAVCVSKTDALQVVESNGRGEGIGFDLANPVTRRQDRGKVYEINGTVWALDVAAFVERGTVYCENMGICVSHNPRLEIDTMQDLAIAQAVFAKQLTDNVE